MNSGDIKYFSSSHTYCYDQFLLVDPDSGWWDTSIHLSFFLQDSMVNFRNERPGLYWSVADLGTNWTPPLVHLVHLKPVF